VVCMSRLILAASLIEFAEPTLPDGIETTNRSIEINVSITEANINELKFSWNNFNHSFYDSSLVLMMNFNNVSALGENATRVVDVSKYSNNGIVFGGASWTPSGKYGGAYGVDGNGYIDAGKNASLNFTTNGFTISGWAYVKGEGNGAFPAFIEKSNGDFTGSPSNQIGFYLAIGYYSNPVRYIKFGVGNGSGDNHLVYSMSNSRLINKWVHVVAIADDQSLSNPQLKLYVDGILVANTSRTYTGSIDSNTNLNIGRWRANNRIFNGTIDEVRIWNRSLTSNEIEQEYYGNVYKYDTDKWTFHTNITLGISSNTYSANAIDSSETQNSTETRTATLLYKTTQYYDDRKAAVVWTGDDLGYTSANIQKFINASNYAKEKKVILSPGIITRAMNSTFWQALQAEIDEGFVSPVSHSASHIAPPYDNATSGTTTENEVCGSQRAIIGNLTFPWQNRYNGSQYMVAWVEPYGQSDSIIRGNLSACNYLSDRSVHIERSELTWADWNTSDELFNRDYATTQGESDSLDALNSVFTAAYSVGGIYHLYMHPATADHNWTVNEKIPQHLSYIGNRSDVWYVGYGDLYSYHYLEDRIKPETNITTRNNQIITARINTSDSERNKYGLSYPITYAFAIPAHWNNTFVFFKNTSEDVFEMMEEKTNDTWWNGIDAYRNDYSQHGVYVSKGFPEYSCEFYLKIVPILATNYDGSTTDFTAEDLSNITNLIIEKTAHGRINYSEAVDLSSGANLNSLVTISQNYISVDSENLPALNTSATLTLYNLDVTNPRIMKDGSVCPSDSCTIISYAGGNLTFTVTQFSSYYVEDTPTTSPPGSSGGGGIFPQTWTRTIGLSDEELRQGIAIDLKAKERVALNISGEVHYIGVKKLTKANATISISSAEIIHILKIGEEITSDVNSDGVYDVRVRLNSIADTKVNVTIQMVVAETSGVEVEDTFAKAERKISELYRWISAEKWSVYGIAVVVILLLILVIVLKRDHIKYFFYTRVYNNP